MPTSSSSAPAAVHAHSSARRGDREHCERHRTARIVALPVDHVDDHQHDPDHRSADQQQYPEVIPGARQERRVERIEYRCPTRDDRYRSHQGADEADRETGPRRHDAANGSAEARRRNSITKAHREEGGQHVGHHRAVQGHGGVIGVRVVEWCRQRAAHQHLPGPQHRRRQKQAKGDPEVEEGQPPSVFHTASFRGGLALRSGLGARRSPASTCRDDRGRKTRCTPCGTCPAGQSSCAPRRRNPVRP